MSKVTIRDVAKAAGVSTATVSNALNDAEVINSETKERVLQVAKELNYVPNMSGRMLKAGKSNMMGFVSSSLTGPYFSKLVEVIQRECEENGYGLMLIYTQKPQIIRNYIFGGGLDGVFIYEGEQRFEPFEVECMEKQQIKGILLDREYEGRTVGSITFDSYLSSYYMTQHLIETGHQKIVFIKGPDDVRDSVERVDGYLAAMTAYHLPVDENSIVQGEFIEEATLKAILEREKTGIPMPDAFLAGNDSSAIGCIRALKQLGYRVPEDISVAGFDDIELAKYFDPAISTVRLPVEEQAKLGVQMLRKLINGEHPEEMSVKMKGELVLRDSIRNR